MNGQSAAVRSLLVRHGVGFAINFTGTLILARALGPAAWGMYSIALVSLLILQGIVERGTVGHLVRSPTTALRPALTIQMAAGTLGAAAVAAGAGPASVLFGTDDLVPLLHAVALTTLAYALRALPLGMLERSSRFGRVAIVEVSDLAAFNGIAVAAVVLGFGVYGIALGLIGRAVVSLVLAWYLSGIRPQLGFSAQEIRDHAAFALPYSASNALSWANVAAAPLIVGILAGPRELGLLQLASTLILYPQLMNPIFARVSFPLYANSQSPDAVARDVQKVTGHSLRYTGTSVLVTAVSAALWVPMIFGPDWQDVVPIMLAVAPVIGFATALSNLIAALNARGHAGPAMLVGLGYAVVYWTCGALLVPVGGALGLTLAQSIATATLAAHLYLHRRLVGVVRFARPLATYLAGCLVLIAVALDAGRSAQLIAVCTLYLLVVLLWPTWASDRRSSVSG